MRSRRRVKPATMIVGLSQLWKPLTKRPMPEQVKDIAAILYQKNLFEFFIYMLNSDLSVIICNRKITNSFNSGNNHPFLFIESASDWRPSGASLLPRPSCFQPQIATTRRRWDKEIQPYPTFEGYLLIRFSQPKISDSLFG